MNESQSISDDAPLTVEEKQTALFAQMVMQSASMAVVLMGRAPNPMTGKTETDLEGARLFIDQLEMLEAKTRGNLTPEEQQLLKQNLMTVRMAFVQTVEEAGRKPRVAEPKVPEATTATPETDESSKKKFTKSYGEG